MSLTSSSMKRSVITTDRIEGEVELASCQPNALVVGGGESAVRVVLYETNWSTRTLNHVYRGVTGIVVYHERLERCVGLSPDRIETIGDVGLGVVGNDGDADQLPQTTFLITASAMPHQCAFVSCARSLAGRTVEESATPPTYYGQSSLWRSGSFPTRAGRLESLFL